MLMPAFHHHETEAAFIGRLLAGYGELEFILAVLLGHVLGDRDRGLRTFFRQISGRSRIETADALLYGPLNKMGFGKQYAVTYGAILNCQSTRNRFAHSNWADWPDYPGLFFTSVLKAVDGHGPIDYPWRHVDSTLLEQWENYFLYTQRCLTFLQERARHREEKLRSRPVYEWPASLDVPPEHNPPEAHAPPWLPLKTDFPSAVPPKKSQRMVRRKIKADRKGLWKPTKKK